MKVLITGGSGFIGTHMLRRSLKMGLDVSVLDLVRPSVKDFDYEFHQVDLRKPSKLGSYFKGVNAVFHLAADPEVRTSMTNPSLHFENNVLATFNVLEEVRKHGVRYFVFTSTSTVYGDARVIPTPETYSPMIPISVYGSTKLACEDLIIGYSRAFNINSLLLRPANIVGPHSTHGVILDFISKLKKNNTRLEVLGDGTQRKSYLHINDMVDATFAAFARMMDEDELVAVYNVGNWDTTSVDEIAEIVCETLGCPNVKIIHKPSQEGRGWAGDVKHMCLDINKIVSIGWKPSMSSNDSVRAATKELLLQMGFTTN